MITDLSIEAGLLKASKCNENFFLGGSSCENFYSDEEIDFECKSLLAKNVPIWKLNGGLFIYLNTFEEEGIQLNILKVLVKNEYLNLSGTYNFGFVNKKQGVMLFFDGNGIDCASRSEMIHIYKKVKEFVESGNMGYPFAYKAIKFDE